MKAAWTTYRQSVSDLLTDCDPYNIVWPDPPTEATLTLEGRKIDKNEYIKTAFTNTLSSDTITYTTTGLTTNITINAREKDISNAKELRDKMIEQSIPELTFRCFDNSFVQLTLSDVTIVISELRDYGFSLYQKKWTLEAAVAAASTREELDLITW